MFPTFKSYFSRDAISYLIRVYLFFCYVFISAISCFIAYTFYVGFYLPFAVIKLLISDLRELAFLLSI